MGASASDERIQVIELQQSRSSMQGGRSTAVHNVDYQSRVNAVPVEKIPELMDAGGTNGVVVQAFDSLEGVTEG